MLLWKRKNQIDIIAGALVTADAHPTAFIYLSAAPVYIAVNPRGVSRSEEDPPAARMLAAQSTISDRPHDIFF